MRWVSKHKSVFSIYWIRAKWTHFGKTHIFNLVNFSINTRSIDTFTYMTHEELFAKYRLDFSTLSEYVMACYDPRILSTLSFEDIRDSLSDGQTASKLWVIDALSKSGNWESKSACVFGGWVGLLCRFMFDYLNFGHVTNLELNTKLRGINWFTNEMKYPERFAFVGGDMYDFDYETNQFDLYVNTSGEHIPSIKTWVEKIPPGKQVLIQSNNYFAHPQHINCVNSAQELFDKVSEAKNVNLIEYSGELIMPQYTRFMVIAKT